MMMNIKPAQAFLAGLAIATTHALPVTAPKAEAHITPFLNHTVDSFKNTIARTGEVRGEAKSNFFCYGKGTKSPVYTLLRVASLTNGEIQDVQKQVKHPSNSFLQVAPWAKTSFDRCYEAGKKMFGNAFEETAGYTNRSTPCDLSIIGDCTPLVETFRKRPEEFLKLGSVNAHGVFSKN